MVAIVIRLAEKWENKTNDKQGGRYNAGGEAESIGNRVHDK